MHILILGGTRFVGRHITETALARGHTVSLLNRGKTAAGLFPQAEALIGDRDGSLEMLRGRRWDAVIDVNGYLPRLVRTAVERLQDCAQSYLFISTISVFAEFNRPIDSEDAPLAELSDPGVETITSQTYGGLKVLCEQAVAAGFGARTTIIRPGYVVGPHDHTDRFTSWLRRTARGGTMLAPGSPEAPIQFIDGRDLAAFTLKTAEEGIRGVFNTVGPQQPLTWGDFLAQVREITAADTRFVWVPDDFLLSQIDAGRLDYNALPIWAPPAEWGGAQVNCARAITAGLRFRPLAETVRDTLAWDSLAGTPRCGLDPEKEDGVLAEWAGGAG